ncbi:carbohydrate ABC transporter permease [Paenibacillus sp. GCM10012307]|uniref:Sugar ABC transporter permease n=1 Tax=Paenibacillus roseus TaxID=2798579 RepID=A0A934J9H1_9BACL|nr:sugar ABC transporter permease [Paenibacillus roseus]MBJ6364023.1 sugar ABC transporter permease [Paenibacillus roseus]
MKQINGSTRRKHLSIKHQEYVAGYSFILLYMLATIIFASIPMLYTFYLSFTDFNSLSKAHNLSFAFVSNYIDVLNDSDAMSSFGKSFLFTIIEIPLMMIGAILLALGMNQKIFARGTIRTMLLIPYVTNITAIAIAWKAMLDPTSGPINTLLHLIGISNPPLWLNDVKLVIPVMAFIYVYQNIAYQAIVLLAALQGVPADLYEAAELDGASKFKRFLNVTLPIISPATFFILIASIIGSTQTYSIVAALTRGGPAGASEMVSFNIIKNAFQFNKFSFAAAQSVLLFAALAALTLIQWRLQKKWVNY